MLGYESVRLGGPQQVDVEDVLNEVRRSSFIKVCLCFYFIKKKNPDSLAIFSSRGRETLRGKRSVNNPSG